MPAPAVRDFLYLDVDITRSLYAQLEGGLLEQATRGREATQAMSGKISGKIPFMADAHAGGDVKWHQSESETRSLHDYMFNVVEATLRDRSGFRDISRSSPWQTVGDASPGSFASIQGRLILKDFEFLKRFMSDYHRLAAIGAHFAAKSNNDDNPGRRSARRIADDWTKDMSKEDAKQIQAFIEWAYGDSLRQPRP